MKKIIEIPDKCPVCGGKTEIIQKNGILTLHCTNHEGCPAQQIGKMMNALGKDGLDVKGLSEKKLAFLLKEGYIENVLDIFRLKNQGDEAGIHKKNGTGPCLENQPGWEIKSVDNMLTAIENARNTTVQKFLYSLNIPLLGNDLSKKLSKYWNSDINEFLKFVESVPEPEGASKATDTLCSIEGIGDEKAQNIVSWADHITRVEPEKYDELKELIGELNFPEVKDSAPADNSLEGLTFVITGSVHEYKNRDEFKASVEKRGGKVAGSVSAKTTALVNNDISSTSGKNAKAKELGIEIISEDDFIARYGK